VLTNGSTGALEVAVPAMWAVCGGLTLAAWNRVEEKSGSENVEKVCFFFFSLSMLKGGKYKWLTLVNSLSSRKCRFRSTAFSASLHRHTWLFSLFTFRHRAQGDGCIACFVAS